MPDSPADWSATPLPPDADDELIAARLAKLRELREQGHDPFTVERYERTHSLAAVREQEEALAEQTVRVAGRVVSQRFMGKAAFMDLADEAGRLQLYLKRDDLGEDAYSRLKLADLGDFLGVAGTVFRTRTGELSLHVTSFDLLAKAVRPLPLGKEKDGQHFGDVTDTELRYRQRYADLAAHPEVRRVFRQRAEIVSAIRRFLDDRGYVEVETPVLQTVAGGAAARPFDTRHNALELDVHLRISLELYLKRLIVGGLEKVYELGRVFRNEGVSTRHNPEFTMLELYEAYTDLDGMMDLVEQLFATLATRLYGEPSIPRGDTRIDLTPPWPRLAILDGIALYAGIAPEELADFETAKAAAQRVGLDTSKETALGGLIEKLHEVFTQPHLVRPHFITDFPVETSPLAKKRPDNPALVRRFEVYVATQECGNAFSEINDPLDQRARFLDQLRQRAAGDAEAHPLDEDYLRALEYGMPPTGGLGVGIDRLVMVLTDTASIRDVILFPLLRPEQDGAGH